MADENKKMALSLGHLLNRERVLRIPPSPTIEIKGIKEKIKSYENTVCIATWNVRSLYMPGKLANNRNEETKYIYMPGISEVRWQGSGKQKRISIVQEEPTKNIIWNIFY